jgi:hypothetical protein
MPLIPQARYRLRRPAEELLPRPLLVLKVAPGGKAPLSALLGAQHSTAGMQAGSVTTGCEGREHQFQVDKRVWRRIGRGKNKNTSRAYVARETSILSVTVLSVMPSKNHGNTYLKPSPFSFLHGISNRGLRHGLQPPLPTNGIES